MRGFKNIGKKEYFNRYGLKYGFLRAIYICNPFKFITNKEIRKLQYYIISYKKLKKQYEKFANQQIEGFEYFSDIKNPIWVYWKQGIENAPEIVKHCINSQKHIFKEKFILLTNDNIDQYIKVPACYIKKVKNGKMSSAAFSDILRFALLEHYGGTWIDATVLLTGNVPKYVLETPFFVFHESLGEINTPAEYCSWLVHSEAHNIVTKEILNLLCAYWNKESYVREYLLVYLFTKMALDRHPEIRDNMPYASAEYSRLLMYQLENTYNEIEYKHILKLTNIHKLTYKLEELVYANTRDFYNHIIKEDFK